MIESFPAAICSYIFNFQWCFPSKVTNLFPQIRSLAEQVTLPSQEKADCLVWKHTSTCSLSLKEAYEFKRHHFSKIGWIKHYSSL
jgi:hypothetical protein